MLPLRFNLARFTPAGAGGDASVTLEGDFVRSVGMRPDVNRVRVSRVELAKIASKLFVPGTLRLYFDSESSPSVTIGGVRIVDYQPGRRGVIRGGTAVLPVEYTLYLSDARADFVAPFGGRVSEGLINPDANDDGLPDLAEVPMSELIPLCCESMGFAPAVLPPNLDRIAPPLNLRWFGVPAEQELAKLLEAAGGVLVPQLDGAIGVHTAGEGGTLPTIPAGRLDSDVLDPAAGRRGNTLILSSAPTAVVETLKVSGVGPGADLQFVVPDPEGVWRPIDDPAIAAAYWSGSTAAAQIKLGFKGVSDTHRDLVKRYAYRCIRLNPDKYNPVLQRVLRRRITPTPGKSKVKLKGLKVTAKRAVKKEDGTWSNSTEHVRCNAEYLLGPNVIAVGELLGRLSGSAAADELTKTFVPLTGDELAVELSIEAAIDAPSGSGRLVPEYSYFGYRRVAGAIVPLDEEEATAVAASPGQGTIFLNLPSLRRVRDAVGGEDNRPALLTIATTIAGEFFAGAAQQTRTIAVSGYLPVDLDGRVHEVRYSQQSLTTTIVLDRLDSASKTRFLSSLARAGQGDATGQGPADALGLGALGGGVQPAVPLGGATPPDAAPVYREWTMAVTAATPITNLKRWTYTVEEQRKAKAGSASGTWVKTQVGQSGSAFNLIESQNDSAGLMGNGVKLESNGFVKDTKLTLQPVPVGTRVRCWQEVLPAGTDGVVPPPEFWFAYENGVDGTCT